MLNGLLNEQGRYKMGTKKTHYLKNVKSKRNDFVGYYWDSKDFFIIEEDDRGATKMVKEEYKDFDDQVAEVRKMQKEIYG